MNVYEDAAPRNRMEISECEKTEDVYQTLHQPPPVRITPSTHGSVRGRKIKVVLLVINTLLLVILLIMVGLFTAKYQQTTAVTGSQTTDVNSEKEELWRLHDEEFYLFWEAEGSCAEAQKFCHDRKSRIGEVTDENKDWIISQLKGKKLWMKIDSVTTANLSETFRHCQLVEGDSESSEREQGWVCGTKRQEPDFPFDSYHDLDHLTTSFSYIEEDDYDVYSTYLIEDPTETPASPRSPAVCVHSLKMYVTLVCVLPSLSSLYR